MSQPKRNRTIGDFKEGRISILVATNVAARGLHIDNLGLIINYDKAQSEEVHLHRIGRTGRMGQEGKAINFIQRKQTMDERMNEDHPDFAWMKQGTDVYSKRESRRGSYRSHTDRSYGHRGHTNSRSYGSHTSGYSNDSGHGNSRNSSHGQKRNSHMTEGRGYHHGKRPVRKY
jgi:superfamily II DNA/RNA helicase